MGKDEFDSTPELKHPMAITKPVVFTSIEDAEVVRNRPVTEETIRKMVQNSNLIGSLAMIGSIAHVQLNIQGVPAPNPDIWQRADGGEITQEDSPLKSVAPDTQNTPDMTGLYVRGAPDHVSGGVGGTPTVDLSHTHVIGDASNGPEINDGNASPNYITPTHAHDLAVALSSAEPIEPAHQELDVYLKIN